MSEELTKSARAERDRILRIYERAVVETCHAILQSGWNKLTPYQRKKQASVAKAFEHATECLKRALTETLPEGRESVADELKERRVSA